MSKYNIQEIKVSDLLLDVRNPRHDTLSDQTETLREIIRDQKGKLIKLIQDIIDNGIDPSALIIAVPSEDIKNMFIVLEGNRRVAALKLLSAPAMATLGTDNKTIDKIKSFSKTYNLNPIEALTCVVFKQREDANHWIELRHTGENEGRGLVTWRAKEKARFNQIQGNLFPALQVVEFVKKNANLNEKDLENLKRPNISSIQRLMSDPYIRETLGIDITDGYVSTNLPPSEIINGLTKIVMDFATGSKTVDDIRRKDNRTEYISEFTRELLPDTTITPITTWRLQSQVAPITPRIPPSKTISRSTEGKRSVPLSTSRRTLIPISCKLSIKKAPRLNTIYRELRSLEVKGFENACAITFRVFLELSVKHYAEKYTIEFNEKEKLVNIIKKVANYMKSNNLMSDNQLKPIHVACANPHKLISTHTLNAYVHNPNLAPKADDLKLTWDDFEKFFEIIWT